MTRKILRIGNSVGITIPSSFVKNLHLKIGDVVDIEINWEATSIRLGFPKPRQLGLGLGRNLKTSS